MEINHKVDIVIPTYNRGKILEETLPTYWNQEYANRIIILDDGSTDDTLERVERLKKKSPIDVCYIKFPKRTLQPHAKNVGIQKASTKFVFIGEDDVFLGKSYIRNLLENLLKLNGDIIAGRRVNIKKEQTQKEALKLANRDKKPIFTLLPFEGYFERYFEGTIKVPHVHSSAVLMKREIINEVTFDEEYKGNAYREETDFFLRCFNIGRKLYLCSDAICFHLRDGEKRKGGARSVSRIANKLIYEYWVWKNNYRFFNKNKEIFKSYYRVKNIKMFWLKNMLARYIYGFYRRWRNFLKFYP